MVFLLVHGNIEHRNLLNFYSNFIVLLSMTTSFQVYQPTGMVDGTKAHQFRQKIQELLQANPKVIVIDFKDVTFMDSSGLGALVLSLKTVRAAGAKLFLCSVNEQVMMLLELTDMHKVFRIFENREELEKNMMNV